MKLPSLLSLPAASAARGGDRGLADEGVVAEHHLHLAGAHVLGDDRRERLQRVVAAERALQVGELGERDGGLRIAERDALLRDPLEQLSALASRLDAAGRV